MRPFELVEWAKVEVEYWLIRAAYEAVLSAIESDRADSHSESLHAKTAIAELAESVLNRICRIIGGATYGRHSPFGCWYEDVRALGFLRPPWALAFDRLVPAPWLGADSVVEGH